MTDLIGIRVFFLYREDWIYFHKYITTVFENDPDIYVKDRGQDFDEDPSHCYIAERPKVYRRNGDTRIYDEKLIDIKSACCMMIATSSETTKQNAWQFMKWWTSTDAQVRFGREIEAVLGSSARYATANIAAIEQLSWSEAQLKVIREQMTWAVGFREVAGGYYTTRHMTNAVRKVTNDKTDPRETLLDYARTINEEINKKRLVQEPEPLTTS